MDAAKNEDGGWDDELTICFQGSKSYGDTFIELPIMPLSLTQRNPLAFPLPENGHGLGKSRALPLPDFAAGLLVEIIAYSSF